MIPPIDSTIIRIGRGIDPSSAKIVFVCPLNVTRSVYVCMSALPGV